MDFLKKINLKLWTPLTLATTLGLSTFLKSPAEYWVMLLVYVATYINLFILMYTLQKLMLSKESIESGRRDHVMIALMFVGKLFIVFGALGIGVHFIGNRIIIPLINYVVQILVLSISIRRN